MSQINTTTGGVPRFLTTQWNSYPREVAEKALAHYIKDCKITPKQFAKGEFRIKMLHNYLGIYDSRWDDIPPKELKTTLPRVLIHSMNTHLQRWKNNYAAVQKMIDELPEAREPSAEVDQN